MRSKPGSLLFITILAFTFVLCLSAGAMADRPGHFDYPIKLLNLETGYLLGPGGDTQVGLGQSGFGVSGRMQLTTDLFFDILTFVNGQVKLGLLVDEDVIPAFAVGVGYYNLISSEFIAETALRDAFADEDMNLASVQELYYVFASASKRIGTILRVHAGYQFRYFEGEVESETPINLEADEDTIAVAVAIEGLARHHSLMTAMDLDFVDNVKVMIELGYDISYRHARGGFGIRFGFSSFNLQLGILWPGMDVDEDFAIPVLPNFAMFWRF